MFWSARNFCQRLDALHYHFLEGLPSDRHIEATAGARHMAASG
jgi:hypothetical protein